MSTFDITFTNLLNEAKFFLSSAGLTSGPFSGPNGANELAASLADGSAPNNRINKIQNVTSFHLEKDALNPSNAFSITIEDNRVIEFSRNLKRGFEVVLEINNRVQMTGYLFNYHLSYSKSGGAKLTIELKDLLEFMAQYTCLPNIWVNNNRVNVHFAPKDTLEYCLYNIANSFYVTSSGNDIGVPILDKPIQISVDEAHRNLELGSGFAFGLRTSTGRNKAGITTAKSLSTSLEHLSQPMKGESYLAYMLRLCKLAGCHLKMANTSLDANTYSNTIICKSPSYDFANGSPFKLRHSYF